MWQNVSTLPKDYAVVETVSDDNDEITPAFYNGEEFISKYTGNSVRVTHWLNN